MPASRRRRNTNLGGVLFVAIVLVLWYLGKLPGVPGPTAVTPTPTRSVATSAPGNSTQPLGQRTKTSGCISQNVLADPDCTPGAIFPDATAAQICVPGYSSKVRNVPDSVKNKAYAEYGIASHQPGEYEVDHLISLELGGSNDIANLWPEPASPVPGFHEKDQVENYLHDQVCSGAISLQDAQSMIAHDWLSVYQSMQK